MMKNILLKIQYDGSLYYGWQKQSDLITVQGEIVKAIEKLTGQQIKLLGAGRTDIGVHGVGQYANFIMDTNIDANRFITGINNFVGEGIQIVESKEVDMDFHARFSAKSKTYKYYLYNARYMHPCLSKYRGHIPYPLDFDAMEKASKLYLGKKDFTSFMGKSDIKVNPIREVDIFQMEKIGNEIVFTIKAKSFLRNMIRIMIGSLVEIGRGKQDITWLKNAIEGKKRTLAGPTISPNGLYLWEIEY